MLEQDTPAPAAESRERRRQATLDVSVIVPILTAKARVREVFEALGKELERLGLSHEFILVFDGVRGEAWREAEQLCVEERERVRSIFLQRPFGDSVCLAAGFEVARGKLIITSPHYVQIDPHELGKMLAAIEGGADLISPWRFPRVDPVLNRLQSTGFNWLMRKMVKAPFHDLNCYFRVLRREVLEDLAIYGDMYRFLPVMALRQGYRVEEVQVRHLQEFGRAGFYGFGVYVRRFLDVLGVLFLTSFTHKPLRFFGVIGGLALLMGGGLSFGLLMNKIFTGDEGLYHRPLFLVGVMLVVLGVQVIGFGLVAEVIIYTQAKNLREYRIERIYE